jgi:tetratricopeptide (TPR) repeat protein
MQGCFKVKVLACAAVFLGGLLAGLPAGAGSGSPAAASTPASRADAAYHLLRERCESQPTNVTVACQFASACFDQCEFSRNKNDRAQFASEGIAACRQALALDLRLAAAHYYLGMDLAQLARTELVGALSLLNEVESEWLTARMLDQDFDYAGADRNLGRLYLDAPGWPLSLGSRANARQHLLRAVSLHPEYPENHLNLIEALLKWNDRSQAAQAAKALEAVLPAAGKQFAGPAWESNWEDWNGRWKAIQAKLKLPTSIRSPHGMN